MMVNNLTGQTFGRLTVIKRNGSNKRCRAIWSVKCECGKEFDVLGNSLTTGNTLSCGCLQKEKAKVNMQDVHTKQWSNEEFISFKRQDMRERFTTHGARNRENLDPLYSTWNAMIGRCNFISSYVRKQIHVCREWRDSFPSFRGWAISHGYERGKHLDRKDNSKNYEPGNCQFLTPEDHAKKSGEEHREYYKLKKEG